MGEADADGCHLELDTALTDRSSAPSPGPAEYLVAPSTPLHGAGQLDLQVWRATVSTWRAASIQHEATSRAATAQSQLEDDYGAGRAGSVASCPAAPAGR